MKRCPQCEFIYEDDQSLCDMDGILLVFDSQQLPKPPTSNIVSTRPQWRNRTVTAAAALVLATVFFLVYYVSTHQRPSSGTTYAPAGVPSTQPAASSSEGAKTSDTPAEMGAAEKKVVVPESVSTSDMKSSNTSKAKPTSAPSTPVEAPKKSKEKPKATPNQKPPSSNQAQPNDSKIGSLIKKTGRLLKKPFRF